MEPNKENNFGRKMGQFMGNVFVAYIAVCLSACMVALTLRFITFLF